MAEKRVGIRDLKTKLSGYIKDVKSGHTIVITERGRPVGRITPSHAAIKDRIQESIRSGAVAWSGVKLKSTRPVARLKRRAKTLAEIVDENRG